MSIPDGRTERWLTAAAVLAWTVEISITVLIGIHVIDESWRATSGVPLGLAITFTVIRVSHGRMRKTLLGIFQAGAASEREANLIRMKEREREHEDH